MYSTVAASSMEAVTAPWNVNATVWMLIINVWMMAGRFQKPKYITKGWTFWKQSLRLIRDTESESTLGRMGSGAYPSQLHLTENNLNMNSS